MLQAEGRGSGPCWEFCCQWKTRHGRQVYGWLGWDTPSGSERDPDKNVDSSRVIKMGEIVRNVIHRHHWLMEVVSVLNLFIGNQVHAKWMRNYGLLDWIWRLQVRSLQQWLRWPILLTWGTTSWRPQEAGHRPKRCLWNKHRMLENLHTKLQSNFGQFLGQCQPIMNQAQLILSS